MPGHWIYLKEQSKKGLVPRLTEVHDPQKGTYFAIRYYRPEEPPKEIAALPQSVAKWAQTIRGAIGVSYPREFWHINDEDTPREFIRAIGVVEDAPLLHEDTFDEIQRLERAFHNGDISPLEFAQQVFNSLSTMPRLLSQLFGSETIVAEVPPALPMTAEEEETIRNELNNIRHTRLRDPSQLRSKAIHYVTNRLLQEKWVQELSPVGRAFLTRIVEAYLPGELDDPLLPIIEALETTPFPMTPMVTVGRTVMRADRYLQHRFLGYAKELVSLAKDRDEHYNKNILRETNEQYQQVIQDPKLREAYEAIWTAAQEKFGASDPQAAQVQRLLFQQFQEGIPTFLQEVNSENLGHAIKWLDGLLQQAGVTPEEISEWFPFHVFPSAAEIGPNIVSTRMRDLLPQLTDPLISISFHVPYHVGYLLKRMLRQYAMSHLEGVVHSLMSPLINDLVKFYRQLEKEQEKKKQEIPKMDAIVISARPESFHALAYPVGGDTTCFGVGGGNGYHKYILAMHTHTFTVFWLDQEGGPRARCWGFFDPTRLEPGSAVVYLTNFYGGGGVNRPKLYATVADTFGHLFARLWGTPVSVRLSEIGRPEDTKQWNDVAPRVYFNADTITVHITTKTPQTEETTKWARIRTLKKSRDVSKLVPRLTLVAGTSKPRGAKHPYQAIRYYKPDKPPEEVPALPQAALSWNNRLARAIQPSQRSVRWGVNLQDTPDELQSATDEMVREPLVDDATMEKLNSLVEQYDRKVITPSQYIRKVFTVLSAMPRMLTQLFGNDTFVAEVPSALPSPTALERAAKIEIDQLRQTRINNIVMQLEDRVSRRITNRLLQESWAQELSPAGQALLTLVVQGVVSQGFVDILSMIGSVMRTVEIPLTPKVTVGNTVVRADRHFQHQFQSLADNLSATGQEERQRTKTFLLDKLNDLYQQITQSPKLQEAYQQVWTAIMAKYGPTDPTAARLQQLIFQQVQERFPHFLQSSDPENLGQVFLWLDRLLQQAGVGRDEISEQLVSQLLPPSGALAPLHMADKIRQSLPQFVFPAIAEHLHAPFHVGFMLLRQIRLYAFQHMNEIIHSLISPVVNDLVKVYQRLEQQSKEQQETEVEQERDVVIISARPESFHALAYPVGGVETCFGVGGTSGHHKYKLAMHTHTFTVFWLDPEGKPRARCWGFFDPQRLKERSAVVYLTNFYGGSGVNRPKLFDTVANILGHLFSRRWGTPVSVRRSEIGHPEDTEDWEFIAPNAYTNDDTTAIYITEKPQQAEKERSLFIKTIDLSRLQPRLTYVAGSTGPHPRRPYQAIRYVKPDEPPAQAERHHQGAIDWLERAAAAAQGKAVQDWQVKRMALEIVGACSLVQDWEQEGEYLHVVVPKGVWQKIYALFRKPSLQETLEGREHLPAKTSEEVVEETFTILTEMERDLERLFGTDTIIVEVPPAATAVSASRDLEGTVKEIRQKRLTFSEEQINERVKRLMMEKLLKEKWVKELSPVGRKCFEVFLDELLTKTVSDFPPTIISVAQTLQVPLTPTVAVGLNFVNSDKFIQQQIKAGMRERVDASRDFGFEPLPVTLAGAKTMFEVIRGNEELLSAYHKAWQAVETIVSAEGVARKVRGVLMQRLVQDAPERFSSIAADQLEQSFKWLDQVLQEAGVTADDITPALIRQLFVLPEMQGEPHTFSHELYLRLPRSVPSDVRRSLHPLHFVRSMIMRQLRNYVLDHGELIAHSLFSPFINDINKFYKEIQRRAKEQEATAPADAIVITATPAGFHALAYPIAGGAATCFGIGGRNGHHRYLLAMHPNTFTVFWLDHEGTPRARCWGFLDIRDLSKKRVSLFLTNFYGGAGVNRPKIYQTVAAIFRGLLTRLWGTPVETVKSDTWDTPIFHEENNVFHWLGPVAYINGDMIYWTFAAKEE